MPRQLTEAQQRGYHREGLAFPLPVLSPPETRRYRAACDDLEARLGGKPRTVEVRQMHLAFPWAYQLATQPRVLDAVEDLLRPGEMSLHDADVLHGSGPNASAVKRVGFVVRYVTPEARPRGGRPPVLL